MKEYKITDRELNKLYTQLNELSYVYKKLMSIDGCEREEWTMGEALRELKCLARDIESQEDESK